MERTNTKRGLHKEEPTRGGNYTERRCTRRRNTRRTDHTGKELHGKGTTRKGDCTGMGTTWGGYYTGRRLYGKDIK